MPTDVNASHETGLDPLKVIADALQEAVDGSPRENGHTAPALGEYWTRMIYNTSYAVSYGVVMPAALVASMLPKENALMHGLVDGARAATDAVLAARQPAESPSDAAPSTEQNGSPRGESAVQ